MNEDHILFVDDQPERCTAFRQQLEQLAPAVRGDLSASTVLYAQSGGEALDVLRDPESRVLVAIVDIDFSKLPVNKELMGPDARREGLDVARALRQQSPNLPLFLFTLSETDVMPADPFVHVVPFDSVVRQNVVSVVLAFLAERHAGDVSAADDLPPSLRRAPGELALRKLARSDLPLLILGETGTGKTVLARWLHRASRRAGRFELVECTRWPTGADPNMMAADLFGQVRGAFTGALQSRTGACEAARDGTLFLDEIAELRPDLQAMLLRAIKEKVIRRLGESQDRGVSFRLVSATNRPTADLRQDLLHRIAAATFELPPLRERPEDIAWLAWRELAGINRERANRDHAQLWFDEEALRALEAHDWEGNGHALSQAIAHAAVLAGDARIIRAEHLPMHRSTPPPPLQPSAGAAFAAELGTPLDDVVRCYLVACWIKCQFDAQRAADLAKVGRATLWRALRREGVDLLDSAGASAHGLSDGVIARLTTDVDTYLRKLASGSVDVAAKATELGVDPARLNRLLDARRGEP